MDCIGEISEEQLISFLKGKKQALCILNSRKRVQKIYEELEGEGVFHLSTIMYPKHRKRILKKIRAHLDAGQDCKVIATSLVEAGVDLDFSSVYRELAGVDSVVQAAGRCNREGRRSAKECRTIVFTFEKQEEIHLPSAIKLPIAVSEQIIRKHSDIASLEAIREYFRRLFHYKGEGLDVKKIIGQFENAAGVYALPFATVAEQFHLIENRTRSILITKEEEGKIIAEKLREKGGTRQLVRDAGQYCVNIYDKDFEAFNGAGMLEQLEMGLYVLRNEDQYSMEKGLVLDVSRGDAIFL